MGKNNDQAATVISNARRRPSKDRPTLMPSVERTADTPETTPATPKPATKLQQLAALLLRDEGATLDWMAAVTGWLPHTTRAALAALRKKGYAISSDKVDGIRTYRAVTPE